MAYYYYMDYAIRPAQKSDASAMYQISVQAHTQSYYGQLIPSTSLSDFMNYYRPSADRRQHFISRMGERIDDKSWCLFVAESDGLIIGYTLAQKLSDKVVQLKGLFVAPTHQRFGVGSALFTTSLEMAGEGVTVRLSLISTNMVARKVYDKNGFNEVASDQEKFFGADLMVMERQQ